MVFVPQLLHWFVLLCLVEVQRLWLVDEDFEMLWSPTCEYKHIRRGVTSGCGYHQVGQLVVWSAV